MINYRACSFLHNLILKNTDVCIDIIHNSYNSVIHINIQYHVIHLVLLYAYLTSGIQWQAQKAWTLGPR